MKTYLIEREIPGASQLSPEELRAITSTSNEAVASLNKPYNWLHSYVAGDKAYCLHQADDAEAIREHARAGDFPANVISEVTVVLDRSGPRDIPR
jgi:hydroxymethylglutaryl-CoA reductase